MAMTQTAWSRRRTDLAIDDEALERAVTADCVQAHFERSLLPAFGVCFTIALAAVPAALAGLHALAAWVVAGVLAVQLAVFLLRRNYAGRRAAAPLRHRLRVAVALAAFSGLAVGIASIALYAAGGDQMFVYVVLALVGLAAGSLGSNAYCVPAMLSYLLVSVPLFLAYLPLRPYDFQVAVVEVGLVFLLGYVILVGLQQARSIRSAIRLQHDRERLLNDLRAQRNLAERARIEAENSNAEKSRFFACASHDLRQPVHALHVYASLLRSSSTAEERAEVMARINDCIDILADLFNALLTVAHAEALEREPVEPQPVPLQAVIDTVVTQFLPVARERGLQLSWVPSRCWVSAERVALERILGNLVANAIRFTEHGEVLVGVRRRRGYAELQVLDTGVGISASDQGLIFDPFRQVSNAGRDASRGYGLGLVIVKRLCRAYGFSLGVDSVPGHGSRFWVRIPLTAAQAVAPVEAAPPPAPAPLSLLFVDDNAGVRDAMCRILGTWNTEVDSCATAEQALALIATRGAHWQCLLLDQRLDGGMTGMALAAVIHQRLGRQLPVALLTGESAGPWMQEARAAGYAVLLKPVKMIRLRAFFAAVGERPVLSAATDISAATDDGAACPPRAVRG